MTQGLAVLLAVAMSAAPKAPKPAPVADPLPAALTTDRPPAVVAAPPPPILTPTLPEDLGNARGQLRHLGYELAKPLQALPGEGRLQTLAVLAFTETGPESKKRELGKLVSAELATVLKRDHALNLLLTKIQRG